MKNKLISFIMIILLIISSSAVVRAAEVPEINFTPSKTEVKAGETFQVMLSAKCNDGINGIDTKFTYESDKVELVSANVVDSNNWSNLGNGQDITVICNSSSKITSADIYTLTFKVKESATAGTNAVIKLDNVLLDSDSATNSEHTLIGKEVTINIVGDSSTKPKQNDENKQSQENEQIKDGNKPDQSNENGKVEQEGEQAKDSNKPAKNNEDSKQSQGNDISKTEEKSNHTKPSSSNTSKRDDTTSTGKLPQTGESPVIIIALVVTGMFSITSYMLYRKYKNI